MKRTLSSILFILTAHAVQAQTTRLYFDVNLNPVTDSTKAATKVLLSKYADDTSLWAASQYTMKNRLMVEGVYKDRALTIPNGDFKYYFNEDTTHYLRMSGGFFNGAKFGEWIEYYPDGKRKLLATYRNNILNGPYEAYTRGQHSEAIFKGQYLKGLKDGEWLLPSGVREIYKDGVKTETIDRRDPEEFAARAKKAMNFQDAREPYEFGDYINDRLKFYFLTLPASNAIRSVVIEFTVNEDGKLSYGKVSGGLDNSYTDKIAKIIAQAPAWKPAKSNGKPVSQHVTYTIREAKRPVYSKD